VMMVLVEMSDPGLVLLPTHRIVRFARPVDWQAVRARLREAFDLRDVPVPAATELMEALAAESGRPVLGMLTPPADRLEVWTLRDLGAVDRVSPPGRSESWRRLDVIALHQLVLGEVLEGTRDPECFAVSYTRDPREAIQSVRDSADTQTA